MSKKEFSVVCADTGNELAITEQDIPFPFFVADDSVFPELNADDLMPPVKEGDRFLVTGFFKRLLQLCGQW